MLKNKIVLITGASSGIGKACAYAFAAAGANLLLCARRLQAVEEVAQNLEQKFHIKTFSFELDVHLLEQVQDKMNALPKEWKQIDVLLNNAGLAAGLDTIQEGKISDWEQMIDTNVKGLLYVTKHVLPVMLERKSGHIINIGSIAGHQVYPKGAVYCATKSAVNVINQGLRMDLLGTNIRVTSVDPGAVETNFSRVRFKGDEAKASAVYAGMEPLMPEDIADAVVYCASRPPHVNIQDMIIMPTAQASAMLIARA
jgi:3-hydroxy acid dehydrogenase/malonic semialdehyde reductase